MKHVFIQGSNRELPTILLLHGTGGNEYDLISIGEAIAPGASMLGVLGNVLENGMPRFFKRLSEGVFDIEDLIFRTNELNQQLDSFAKQYDFARNRVVAVGYSNGANIAASLLYHHANSLMGAVLLHAMVPREGVELPALEDTSVFIGAGKRDPLIDPAQTRILSQELQQAGAQVTEYWTEGGHQLTRDEIVKAEQWFKQHYNT